MSENQQDEICSIERTFKRAHMVNHDVFNTESFMKKLVEYDAECHEHPQDIVPYNIGSGAQLSSCKLIDDEYHVTINSPSEQMLKMLNEHEVHIGAKVLLKHDNDPVVTVMCGITFYVIKDDQQIPVFGCSRSPIPAFDQYFSLDKY